MACQISNYTPSYNWVDRVRNLDGNGQTRDLAKVKEAMHRIVGEEEALAEKALSDPWIRYPVAVIGGGALNVAELTLEGISVFAPSLVAADLLIGIGFLAGLFNFREGILSIEEGLKAWKNNDRKLALRLLLQGSLLSLLGLAMFALSISRVCALTCITTFFAANPFILPVLFFALSLFLLVETLDRLIPVIQGKDLGSRLELPKLRAILERNDSEKGLDDAAKWVQSKIKGCLSPHTANRGPAVQKMLDEYKAEIGFPASLETFKLFEMILERKKKEELIKQIKKVEEKISSWNQTLCLKVLSVVLAAAGFSAGMSAIGLNSQTIDGVQNLAMAVAQAVPLYLDIAKPFEREIPIVISREDGPKAKTDPQARWSPGSAA